MFSKTKRFEPIAPSSIYQKAPKKQEPEKSKTITKPTGSKTKGNAVITAVKSNSDINSQTGSLRSTKSFVTPRPVKTVTVSGTPGLKKPLLCGPTNKKQHEINEIIKAHEVEIRNKDYTISEYNKQIEDLKNEIANLQKQVKEFLKNDNIGDLDIKLSKVSLNDFNEVLGSEICGNLNKANTDLINQLRTKIINLEKLCEKLEAEVSQKQVELSSLEEIIIIRDSLCKDLQEKLTVTEKILEETRQGLEMVKGQHALALEANESIRREYKAELETLKLKHDEEKQIIISKNKTEQENIKVKYNSLIEAVKTNLVEEKDDLIKEFKQKLSAKEEEMKAKLEQVNEATREKLRLCEIQFDERTRTIQEHWAHQQDKVKYLENETAELKCKLNLTEEKVVSLQKEINSLSNINKAINNEKLELEKQKEEAKDEAKKRYIDFENEINKLKVEVDNAINDKSKFEMSLSMTRDIVDVLTMRLRKSDNELENLESKVQTLTNSKEMLEKELTTYKNTLNNTVMECNEYKEALVNILKSKAALAKEHTRIMEHNVSLIESLQNVEKEAYRELGSIKNELIEDVELLKKESTTQIQMLRDEVEQKRVLCEAATEHAGQAAAAAEQARALLARAAAEFARLEADNHRLHQQIEDQQSIVVELSLLRQENEELTMTVAKQSSIIEKMKKEKEQTPTKPKSPSVVRKTHIMGKENLPNVISPLRERNH